MRVHYFLSRFFSLRPSIPRSFSLYIENGTYIGWALETFTRICLLENRFIPSARLRDPRASIKANILVLTFSFLLFICFFFFFLNLFSSFLIYYFKSCRDSRTMRVSTLEKCSSDWKSWLVFSLVTRYTSVDLFVLGALAVWTLRTIDEQPRVSGLTGWPLLWPFLYGCSR